MSQPEAPGAALIGLEIDYADAPLTTIEAGGCCEYTFEFTWIGLLRVLLGGRYIRIRVSVLDVCETGEGKT